MELKKFINYLNRLWTQTVSVFQNTSKQNTDRVIKAIQDKEYETLSPTDITTPLLRGLEDVKGSIEGKKVVESFTIKNPKDISGGIEQGIESLSNRFADTLKEEIGKLDKEVIIKNDLSQLLGLFRKSKDTKDLLSVLKRIEERIPEVKENADYTLLLSELIEKIESLNLAVDFKPLEAQFEKLAVKLKEAFETSSKNIHKGQIIGRGGGYSSVGIKNASETRINPATAEKQDNIITAIGAIPATDVSALATSAKQLPDNHQVSVSNFPATQPVSVGSLPLPTGAATAAKQDDIVDTLQIMTGASGYDTVEVDTTDPVNIVITKKKLGATVDTKTIQII